MSLKICRSSSDEVRIPSVITSPCTKDGTSSSGLYVLFAELIYINYNVRSGRAHSKVPLLIFRGILKLVFVPLLDVDYALADFNGL